MEEFEIEVGGLKHNFAQIMNLAKNLLAKNEVLKARLKEQETTYNCNLAELEKEIDDLRHKNMMLQRRLNITEEGEPNVIARDYQETMKESSCYNKENEEAEDVVQEKKFPHFDQASHSSYDDPESEESSHSNRSI